MVRITLIDPSGTMYYETAETMREARKRAGEYVSRDGANPYYTRREQQQTTYYWYYGEREAIVGDPED